MIRYRTIVPGHADSGNLYRTLASLVVPRPIALVGSVSGDRAPNLAPFSFFMLGGADPPSLAVSPVGRSDGRPKDTLRNIEETGEFVVNLVDRALAEAMNSASAEVGPDVDEWRLAGLTPLPSEDVGPPRVAESPVQFECRLFEIVRHGGRPRSANYVIGEIVRLHVAESLWREDRVDPNAWRPIARLGGSDYLDTDIMERFSLVRPKA
ncbi:MAG: flavin reductase family protein [Fimbriimonadaceae bacterium]|nr:flavin reductase family protein [Fimbriimonadaceae bacterium]